MSPLDRLNNTLLLLLFLLLAAGQLYLTWLPVSGEAVKALTNPPCEG